MSISLHRFLLLTTLLAASCAPSVATRPGDRGAHVEGDDDAAGGDAVIGGNHAAAGAPALDDEAVAESSAAEAAPIRLQALFAVPLASGKGDPALEDKIVELVGQAIPGSHVRMALYELTHTRPARALVAAARRGVHVEVVLDQQANQASTAALAPGAPPEPTSDEAAAAADAASDAAALASTDDAEASDIAVTVPATASLNGAVTILKNGLPGGALTFCTRGSGSCQGDHINHNKLYLFSALSDGSRNVVVQSSANLTTFLLHNNLVISRNDKDLYDGYVRYWKALQQHHENLNYYRSVTGAHTIAYFFPRAQGDTIVSVLDKVKCTSASKIRVAMAFFTDSREQIAARLVQLRSRGCDVQVVMRKAGENSSAGIIKKLRDGHIKVGLYPDAHANIHSKYLLIDSEYDTQGKGFVRRHLVFTGSHNYTGGALRHNDEALLRVDDAAVFDAFMTNWNTIRAQIP
ncbi:MAG TPA: phospholipase D-like domain-containing protein [Kofleriaceae bacterium]|jgi:phosphatidylserine/phosphatidylglycerophosphate/cardiolipin synthase-like enzyme|nr:phospholipase D-like domain-containing protein [Kofleriaceae bacterium]